jgi:8-oxo-dGTP diphosphatase
VSSYAEQIRAELATIHAFDAVEQQQLQAARAWVDSGAALCRTARPATPPMHLVSYVVLIDGPQLLLVDHRNAQLWLPAGGHVEPDEHPRLAAARELQEELGVALEQPAGPPRMLTISDTVGLTAGHTDVSLWYVVPVSSQRPLQWDRGEFQGVRWFGFDDLPLARCDPHLARFVAKLRADVPREQPGLPTERAQGRV